MKKRIDVTARNHFAMGVAERVMNKINPRIDVWGAVNVQLLEYDGSKAITITYKPGAGGHYQILITELEIGDLFYSRCLAIGTSFDNIGEVESRWKFQVCRSLTNSTENSSELTQMIELSEVV